MATPPRADPPKPQQQPDHRQSQHQSDHAREEHEAREKHEAEERQRREIHRLHAATTRRTMRARATNRRGPSARFCRRARPTNCSTTATRSRGNRIRRRNGCRWAGSETAPRSSSRR